MPGAFKVAQCGNLQQDRRDPDLKDERPMAGPFEDTEVYPQIVVSHDTTLR